MWTEITYHSNTFRMHNSVREQVDSVKRNICPTFVRNVHWTLSSSLGVIDRVAVLTLARIWSLRVFAVLSSQQHGQTTVAPGASVSQSSAPE